MRKRCYKFLERSRRPVKLYLESLRRGHKAEDFSRIIIEPRLDALNLRRRHLVEVRPFRELPPYHAVNILVRAALARAIRMAVIDRRPLCILVPGAPLDAVSIRELGAVVYDYRLENLIEHRAVNTLEAV